MAQVLIVEDSLTQAAHLLELVTKLGYTGAIAGDGLQALDSIKEGAPDVVLADLVLPGLSGLQLVEAIRRTNPEVPIVLVTGQGSEEVAAEALMKGAIGYIPKRRLERDLPKTLQNVLGILQADRRHQRVLSVRTETASSFVVDNSPELIPHLVAYLRDCVSMMGLSDETGTLRIGVAVTEALENAMFHGNLELSSDLREDGGGAWHRLATERRAKSPYKDRRVHLSLRVSRREATFVVRDEGPGFNPKKLADPTDSSNLLKCSGRGILLMKKFMDEVFYNANGNQVTLIKRRD